VCVCVSVHINMSHGPNDFVIWYHNAWYIVVYSGTVYSRFILVRYTWYIGCILLRNIVGVFWYRVPQIHRVRCNIGHFLQVSLQLLVKLAGNDLYHNEPYESRPPCTVYGRCILVRYMTHVRKHRHRHRHKHTHRHSDTHLGAVSRVLHHISPSCTTLPVYTYTY
jgi:hypothetical protein